MPSASISGLQDVGCINVRQLLPSCVKGDTIKNAIHNRIGASP